MNIFTPPPLIIPALLDGSVTQIRVPLDPQPKPGIDVVMMTNYDPSHAYHAMTVGQAKDTEFFTSPFGLPGDELVCLEEWGLGSRPCPYTGCVDGVEYKNDEQFIDDIESLPLNPCEPDDDFDWFAVEGHGWQPADTMPLWASRLRLRVKDVRVQRLQDTKLNGTGFDNYGSFHESWCNLYPDCHIPDPWCFVAEVDRVKGQSDE